MKYHVRTIVVAITAIVLLSNCASSRINLLKNNTLRIDKISSKKTHVGNVYAYQDGDTLQISGKFIPRYAHVKFFKGHADVVIIDREGKIINKTSVATFPKYWGRRRSRGLKEIKFSASIKAIPSFGSVVRVAFHEDLPKFVNTFSCGENAALQNHESK